MALFYLYDFTLITQFSFINTKCTRSIYSVNCAITAAVEKKKNFKHNLLFSQNKNPIYQDDLRGFPNAIFVKKRDNVKE